MNAARACLLALLLCWAFAAAADVAVPPLTGRVVDQTGTLSRERYRLADQTLKDFEARKGSQIAVLIVPTTEPETIEQYSIRVAEAWKIGRKKIDDGALLVVAKNDRKLRIEVGYGLEGALTDVTAKRIIDEVITPKFRSGDFAGGISAWRRPHHPRDRWRAVAGAGARGELPACSNNIDPFNPFCPVAVIVVGGAILRTMLGRLFGSVATGGMVGALAWFIAASLAAVGYRGVIAFIFTMFGERHASSGGAGT